LLKTLDSSILISYKIEHSAINFIISFSLLTFEKIANELDVSYETIKNDKKYLKNQAIKITNSGTEELAYQYSMMIQNILYCNNKCWEIFQDKNSSPKIKLQALKTTIECSRELNQLVKDSTSVTTLEILKKKIEEISATQDNTVQRSYMTVRLPSLVDSHPLDSSNIFCRSL